MTYFSILLECAWKASIIPLGDDTTFFAMKDFGGYNMTLPFLLAVTGATAGQMFNWWVGKFLLLFRDKFKIREYWYNRVTALFNQYGIFLLLFSWAPLLNLLPVLAGFVGTKRKVVFTLVLAGQVYNYGQYLF